MGSGMAEKLRAWPAAAAILLFIVTANLCPAGRGLSLPIEMAPGCRLGRRRQLQSLELDHLAKMNQLIHAGDSHQPASSSTGAGAAAEAAGLSVPLDMYGQDGAQTDLHFFGEYFARIRIGTPGRVYRVQLDTGSASLVLLGPEIASQQQPPGRAYDPTESTSSAAIGCDSQQCSGLCDAESCRQDLGAVCGSTPAGGDSLPGGRCCTVDEGCFFLQAYADKTAAGGAMFSDLVQLDSADLLHTWHSPLERSVVLARSAGDEAGRVIVRQVRTVQGRWQPDGIDGILGIGYSWLNCHPTCTESPMDALLASAKASAKDSSSGAAAGSMRNIFGLCLQGMLGKASSWDIGQVDGHKHSGPLHWLPILHESYYLIPAPRVLRVRVGSKRTSKIAEHKQWGLVVIDSGTPHTAVPSALFETIGRAVTENMSPSAPENAAEVFTEGCMLVSDQYGLDEVAFDYPALLFTFRDTSKKPFELEWTADKYLYFSRAHWMQPQNATPAGQQWLCTGILGSSDATKTILGAVFLHSFYIAFDRDNKTIGLAPVADCSHGLPASALASSPDGAAELLAAARSAAADAATAEGAAVAAEVAAKAEEIAADMAVAAAMEAVQEAVQDEKAAEAEVVDAEVERWLADKRLAEVIVKDMTWDAGTVAVGGCVAGVLLFWFGRSRRGRRCCRSLCHHDGRTKTAIS